ncbi:MAG: lysylphosphatidylglycerol synthase transmembrane domain-containing protein [Gaiellaceae bacterium]
MTNGAQAAPRRALRPLLVAAGLAGSALFLYLALRDVDFDAFWRALRESSWAWLVPALGALAGSVALRVARWRYLFDPAARPPVRAATRALLVGELLNSFLPLRAGEVARVVVLHRDTGASRAQAAGTLVAERLLDTLALLVLLFVTVPFIPEVTWLRTATVLLAVAALALVGTVVVLRLYGERPLAVILRPFGRLLRFSPERTAAAAARLLSGGRAFRELRAGALAFALSVVIWLGVALSFWLAMRAVHLELGFGAALLVAVATTFALVIPSLPSAVGVFEAATLVSLQPYGVDDARALACAVVLHVLSFAPFIAAGLVALRLRPGWRAR